ncbi:MAG: phosphoribosyltransferase [Acidimicrobiaceae bacterium]|nr:phosphoribosyltransferase [Acidimicrobiaceae bacterium]
MLERIHVMGAYWREDHNLQTPLGELIASAKDHHSATAVTRLQEQLSDFVHGLETTSGAAAEPHADTLAVPVPNGSGSNRRLVPALASAVADAMGASVCEALTRQETMVRMRDTPLQQRLAVVQAAGYEIGGQVAGHGVVLVDDVVMTGTTLRYLARLLRDAGAARVIAVVAAQTRRAGQ